MVELNNEEANLNLPANDFRDAVLDVNGQSRFKPDFTDSDLAHIDHSLVDINEYKAKDTHKALRFREWLLSDIDAQSSAHVHRYKAFFFACILIKHINEYGLGHYQALAVKRLFKTQAEHLGLGYDALHQYFILSPLILDAKDYLALKNSEDALWLINNCLKSLTNIPTLNILLPFNKVEEALTILERSEHELGVFINAYQCTRLDNAWQYNPNKADLGEDMLNIVLTYDNTTPNMPILYLVLKKCSQLLKMNETVKATDHRKPNQQESTDIGYQVVKQAIDDSYDEHQQPQERLVLGNTRSVMPPKTDEDSQQANKAHEQEQDGRDNTSPQNSELKKTIGKGVFGKLLSKFKSKKIAAIPLKSPATNAETAQKTPQAASQSTETSSKSEGETTQNVERLKGSNIQQSQHNNQINEQAHLLWHIADMGIFIYTKNPPSLY